MAGEMGPSGGGELSVPIELAELLHATLGPLAEILENEGHPWADMARRVLTEYTSQRNRLLKYVYGDSIVADIAHHTFRAVERVCDLTEAAISDAVDAIDFVKWSAEVNGDHV
jgi:hypothetical protein